MSEVGIEQGQVRTPVGDAPVIPLMLISAGIYLAWFAVHYWRERDAASGHLLWPSDPIKAVLQGKPVPGKTPAPQATATAEFTSALTQLSPDQSGGGTSTGTATNPSGAAGGDAATNQNIAKMLAIANGHSDWTIGAQWSAWVDLWDQESGWRADALNPASGAYGVAQALGHGQAGTAGKNGRNEYGAEYGLTVAQAQAANSGNASDQILWGIGYIAADYGDPVHAEAHEKQHNWY